MFYLTCTTITSVDLAHYGVARAKDWVSVDCGTTSNNDIWGSLIWRDAEHICMIYPRWILRLLKKTKTTTTQFSIVNKH